MANLTQLTRLELQNNQIADMSPLADLANLKDVMLLGNPLLSTAQSTIDVLEAGGTTVGDDILLLPLGDNNTLRLDGDGDYVEIPDSPSLDVTGNITLECWVNVNEITHESGRLIVKTWAGDKNPWMVYGLVREGGSDRLVFGLADADQRSFVTINWANKLQSSAVVETQYLGSCCRSVR